jgi:hypothetical protein
MEIFVPVGNIVDMPDTTYNMQPTMSIDQDGDKVWRLNDQYHREDGPAIEYLDGDEDWYLHGDYHRTNGPAIVWHDGTASWYLYGSCYTFDGWLIANTEISDEEKVMMKLKYG